jgi:hypothetical protein
LICLQVINNIHVLAKHVKAQGIGGEGVPAIEDSKRFAPSSHEHSARA